MFQDQPNELQILHWGPVGSGYQLPLLVSVEVEDFVVRPLFRFVLVLFIHILSVGDFDDVLAKTHMLGLTNSVRYTRRRVG